MAAQRGLMEGREDLAWPQIRWAAAGANRLPVARHIASRPGELCWGYLPGPGDAPVAAVRPGEVFSLDTVSHEGMLEDQGSDPVAFFGRYGVAADQVLDEPRRLAAAGREGADGLGPHVVTGPIEVEGARVGDCLAVDVLGFEYRAPYGVVSSRHGRGAVKRFPPAGAGPFSAFCHLDAANPAQVVMPLAGGAGGGAGRSLVFPAAPFAGILGVASPQGRRHSVPPGPAGGNLDIALLGAGATLYLPVLADGAGLHVGDPHFAQGDGEVALTALEAPLRVYLRLRLAAGGAAGWWRDLLPFAETRDFWVAIGLDRDLDAAVEACAERAAGFLGRRFALSLGQAVAYLSAAADFRVSQVVDLVKGVHCVIRKADFAALPPPRNVTKS
ncbi:MAG: acetamidase/formamidase family protein [Bifidobacteriaceae bacterium]|nr:acetamidase/formamidase family protein [Bifidobacteriaceae bacterium]